MAQPTPGPWTVEKMKHTEMTWVMAGAASVAMVSPYNLTNARLVAAAPELLAALEDFLLDHRNGLGPDPERLSDLIAKAKGGA